MKMPMDLTEVKLRRKDVFEGKIMTVHVDDVRLPNGEEATRDGSAFHSATIMG